MRPGSVQALEGLNRLTKGLTLQLCTVKRPAVGQHLFVPLQAALSVSKVRMSPIRCLFNLCKFTSDLNPVTNKPTNNKLLVFQSLTYYKESLTSDYPAGFPRGSRSTLEGHLVFAQTD